MLNNNYGKFDTQVVYNGMSWEILTYDWHGLVSALTECTKTFIYGPSPAMFKVHK